MSHFTNIKTKLKNKDFLIQALHTIGYTGTENVLLKNPSNHQHEEVQVEIGVTKYDTSLEVMRPMTAGFKINDDGVFELVTEVDTWHESLPIERFLQKITQVYARHAVVETAQLKGFKVTTEQKDVDNTIEIVMEKW
tara:strand:+ start:59 stop:469 length:411 start_codon:yes stop_codon:yes gene_type:complete